MILENINQKIMLSNNYCAIRAQLKNYWFISLGRTHDIHVRDFLAQITFLGAWHILSNFVILRSKTRVL